MLANDDVLRQVVVQRAETVVRPRPDGWELSLANVPAGVKLQVRAVVVVFGPHRADHSDVVRNARHVRNLLAEPATGAARLPELVGRAEHLGHALDEGKALSLEQRVRARLHVQALQLGLEVKQVERRRRARHVQVDDRLGAGGQW